MIFQQIYHRYLKMDWINKVNNFLDICSLYQPNSGQKSAKCGNSRENSVKKLNRILRFCSVHIFHMRLLYNQHTLRDGLQYGTHPTACSNSWVITVLLHGRTGVSPAAQGCRSPTAHRRSSQGAAYWLLPGSNTAVPLVSPALSRARAVLASVRA